MAVSRDELLAQIAAEQARLAALDEEREGARQRVEALRQSLAETPHPVGRLPVVASAAGPTTASEKVRLFRSLFRGREDVFPTRFVSRKTGKQGYAPACANKFVRGMCELPRVKCSECPNQAFLPVGDQVVLDHLRGQHVMGVYPLLENKTCSFLAVDFDESSWKDDVSALGRHVSGGQFGTRLRECRRNRRFPVPDRCAASSRRRCTRPPPTRAGTQAPEPGSISTDATITFLFEVPVGGFRDELVPRDDLAWMGCTVRATGNTRPGMKALLSPRRYVMGVDVEPGRRGSGQPGSVIGARERTHLSTIGENSFCGAMVCSEQFGRVSQGLGCLGSPTAEHNSPLPHNPTQSRISTWLPRRSASRLMNV